MSRRDDLIEELASVDDAGVSEKDDSWVVNHGYGGGPQPGITPPTPETSA
jgi:hypothetical protein